MRPLRLTDLKASFGRWQEGLAETGWNSLYWNNHDQPRVVSRFGDDGPEHRVRSAKMLATVLHLHRGTPYVYQGEELGMTNARFDRIEAFRDIESLNHHAEAVARGDAEDAVLAGLRTMGRDNARTPMQWDASEHAGFTSGEPWIPVNPNFTEINAEAAVADPDSVFHHYRRLIELRHDEPVVAHGDFTMLLPDDERVYAFTRRLGDVELLVLGNFTGDSRAGRAAGGRRRARARQLRRRRRGARPAPVGGARAAAGGMTPSRSTPRTARRARTCTPAEGEPRGALDARPRRGRRRRGARPRGGDEVARARGLRERRARRAALPRGGPQSRRRPPSSSTRRGHGVVEHLRGDVFAGAAR